MPSQLLLKGAIILVHSSHNKVASQQSDILIIGNRIAKVAPNLTSEDAQILDCTNKIISPGFVDTHHHTWQTQLKGRHGDDLFADYMPKGNFTGYFYEPEDVRLGNLTGALECIGAGTTTILDHSHISYSEEHVRAAAKGLIDSGIRAGFYPSTTFRTKGFDKDSSPIPEPIQAPEHFLPTMEKLAKESSANWPKRVFLGVGYEAAGIAPNEYTTEFLTKLRSFGVDKVSVHEGAIFHAAKALHECGLLDGRIVLAHANGLPAEEAQMIKRSGAGISSTPSTELQMGLGWPTCFEEDYAGCSSFGIDCHSATAGSIVSEARLGLQATRCARNLQSFQKDGKPLLEMSVRVATAYNLMTMGGAKVMGMEKEVGSVEEGKLADLLIFDATSPAMLAAAANDPVAAILLHSSPADIDTVIVDGVIRKQNGKLLAADVDGGKKEWTQIVQELMASKAALDRKMEGIKFKPYHFG